MIRHTVLALLVLASSFAAFGANAETLKIKPILLLTLCSAVGEGEECNSELVSPGPVTFDVAQGQTLWDLEEKRAGLVFSFRIQAELAHSAGYQIRATVSVKNKNGSRKAAFSTYAQDPTAIPTVSTQTERLPHEDSEAEAYMMIEAGS